MANTTLRVGSVTAEIKLQKVSQDLKAHKWEVRKLDADGNVLGLKPQPEVLLGAAAEAPAMDLPMGDPLVDPVANASPLTDRPIIPQNREQAISRDELAASMSPVDVAMTQRGVTLPDGSFVDLTDRLAKIDDRVSLDGLQIVAAINRAQVPAERVRDAHYVAAGDDNARKVLGLLHYTLKGQQMALAVRWTKRTNQALGILVPRAGHLVLLEVEFAEAMRPVPAGAKLDGLQLTEAERFAAAKFVDSLHGKRADLDAVRDERRALHDELLAAAKNGEAWALPEADSFDDDLAALLSDASPVEA